MSALPVFAINLWLAGIPVLLITASMLTLLRHAPARLRYLLAVAGFAAVIAVPIALTREAAPVMMSATELQQSAGEGSIEFALVTITLWAIGSLFLIARDVRSHLHLHREQRSWRPARIPADSSRFRIVLSDEGAPRTHGLLRPVIVLPAHLASAECEIVRLVVAHEASHARWRDPMVHAAIRVVRSIFWFALPLWIAERLVIREREAAADEAAVASEAGGSRARYAETLVEFCRIAPRRSALSVQLGAAADLDYRVRRILRASSGAGSFVIALGIFTGGFFLLAFAPLAELPGEVVVEVEGVRAVQKLDEVTRTNEVQAVIRTQIENAIATKIRATTERATQPAERDEPVAAAVTSAVEASGTDDVGPSPPTPLPPGEREESSPLPRGDDAIAPVLPVPVSDIDDEVIVIRNVHRHRHVDRRDGERSEEDVTVDTGRSRHPVALFHRGVTKPIKWFVRRVRGAG